MSRILATLTTFMIKWQSFLILHTATLTAMAHLKLSANGRRNELHLLQAPHQLWRRMQYFPVILWKPRPKPAV